jgi:hypothetical protein
MWKTGRHFTTLPEIKNLGSFMKEKPAFVTSPEKIRFLHEPSAFYQKLIVRINSFESLRVY